MSGFSPQDERYARLVNHYSRYIQSPVLRLKFLNNALRAAPPRDFWARLPMVGTLPERATLIFEVSKLMPPASSLPVAFRVTSLLYRVRYAVYALSLVAGDRRGRKHYLRGGEAGFKHLAPCGRSSQRA